MEPGFKFPKAAQEKPVADFSNEVLEMVREKAKAMLLSGSEMEGITIGEAGNALYISLNPENIVGWKTEKVNDRVIYIGQKRT